MNPSNPPPALSESLQGLASDLLDPAQYPELRKDRHRRRSELSRCYSAYGLPGWLLILRHYLWTCDDALNREYAFAALQRTIDMFWEPEAHPALGVEARLQLEVARAMGQVWASPELMIPSFPEISAAHRVSLAAVLRIAQALRPELVIPEDLMLNEELKEITLPLLLVKDSDVIGDHAKLTIRISPFIGNGRLIPGISMSLIERGTTWLTMESNVREFLKTKTIWPTSSEIDVEWSVEMVGPASKRGFSLSGGSAGATIAVGLCTLLDPHSSFLPGFVRRLAISATISADGLVGKVSGTETKLNSLRNQFFPPVRAVALSHDGFILDAVDQPKVRDHDVWYPVPLNLIKAAGFLPEGIILQNQFESYDLIDLGSTYNDLTERILAYQRTFHWEDNPYRGLDFFELEHASVFFGRDEEIAAVHQMFDRRETEQSDGCAFVAIIGSSGSGKSSFARAGFAASLISPPPGSHTNIQWHFVGLSPSQMTDDFHLAIIDRILIWDYVDSENMDRQFLASELREDPVKFLSEILPKLTKGQEIASAQQHKLLLLIDQFEEIQTLPNWRNNDDLIKNFLGFLLQLSRSGHCRVLITLRSDYDAAIEKIPESALLLGDWKSKFPICPLREEKLRAIIARPADAAGAIFEAVEWSQGSTLADRLIASISHQTNALPLLQFILYELYEKCKQAHGPHEPVILTNTTYDEEIGGIEGAIKRHAEKVYESLSDDIQPSQLDYAFKTIFSRLITSKDDGGWTGIPRKESSLINQNVERDSYLKILNAFDTARILETRKDNPYEHEPTYLLRHDSIIHSWPRFTRLADEIEEHQNTMKQISMILVPRYDVKKRHQFIPKGLLLTNAINLRTKAFYLLDTLAIDLIDRSIKRSRVNKIIITAVISVFLLNVIISLILLSNHYKNAAEIANVEKDAEMKASTELSKQIIDKAQKSDINDEKQKREILGSSSISIENPKSNLTSHDFSLKQPSELPVLFSDTNPISILDGMGLKRPKDKTTISVLHSYFQEYDDYHAHYLRAILFFTQGALSYEDKDFNSSINYIGLSIKSLSNARSRSSIPEEIVKVDQYKTRIKSRLSDVMMATADSKFQQQAAEILRECVKETADYSTNPLVNQSTIDKRNHYYKIRLAKALAAVAKNEGNTSDEAIKMVEEAMMHARKSFREYPLATPLETDRQLASQLTTAGEVLRINLSNPRKALPLFEESLHLREHILKNPISNTEDLFNAVGGCWYLAAAHSEHNKLQEIYRKAIDYSNKIISSPSVDNASIARAHSNIGYYNILSTNLYITGKEYNATAIETLFMRTRDRLDLAYEAYQRCEPSEYVSREISEKFRFLGESYAAFYHVRQPKEGIDIGEEAFLRAISMLEAVREKFLDPSDYSQSQLMDLTVAHLQLGFLYASVATSESADKSIKNFQQAKILALDYCEKHSSTISWGLATSGKALMGIARSIPLSNNPILLPSGEESEAGYYYERAFVQYELAISKSPANDFQWIEDSRRDFLYYYCEYLKKEPDKKETFRVIARNYFEASEKCFKQTAQTLPDGNRFWWWMYSGLCVVDSLYGKDGSSKDALRVNTQMLESCKEFHPKLLSNDDFINSYILCLEKLSECELDDAKYTKKEVRNLNHSRLNILYQARTLAFEAYNKAPVNNANDSSSRSKVTLVRVNNAWLELAKNSGLGQEEISQWIELQRNLQ